MRNYRPILLPVVILILLFGLCLSPLLYGTRPLTEQEHSLLTATYASSVDLPRVRIKSGGPLTWIYPGVTIGNVISFPRNGYTESAITSQALLTHEVCHVWQYQHHGLGYIPRSVWELLSQRDTYVIHFDPTTSWEDYDIEEQCEIAADYFRTHNPAYQPYIDALQSLSL